MTENARESVVMVNMTNMMEEAVDQLAGQEKMVRDHQAAEYFRKGMEIVNGSASPRSTSNAIENFSIAISLRLNQTRYFVARANAFRAINEYEHAVEDYSSAIALDGRVAAYYASRGTCYRRLGNNPEALEDLTSAIELDAKKGGHYLNRALVFYDVQFYKEAIIDFTKALEERDAGSRLEFRAYTSRGNCYRRMGNFTKALEDMNEAIQADPRNPSGYNIIAQTYCDIADYQNSIKYFDAAIGLQEDNATYYNNRGMAYFRMGKEHVNNAFQDFHKAIQLNGKDPQFYYNRGIARLTLAVEQDRQEKAMKAAKLEAELASAGNEEDTPAQPVLSRGSSSLARRFSDDIDPAENDLLKPEVVPVMDQLEAALDDISHAAGMSPTTKYIHGKGLVYAQMNKCEDALNEFHRAYDNDPQHLDSLYQMGLMHHVLKNFDEASRIFLDLRYVIKNDRQLLESHALVYQDQDKHDKAVNVLNEVLNGDIPSRPYNLYLRGESLLRLNKFPEALDDFSAAIEAGLTSSAVYNSRGVVQRITGSVYEAIEDFSAAILKDQCNSTFRFNRSLCYLDQGRYGEAEPDLQMALSVNESDPRFLFYMGVICYNEDRYDETLSYLSRALDNDPPSYLEAEIHYHLGLTYANQYIYFEAIDCFSAAITNTPNRKDRLRALHERAKCLQMEKRYDEALSDFTKVIRQNPTNAHAYFRRAFLYKALGQIEAAAEDFEKAKMLDPDNPNLLVNYRDLHDTECIILCPAGEEPEF